MGEANASVLLGMQVEVCAAGEESVVTMGGPVPGHVGLSSWERGTTNFP